MAKRKKIENSQEDPEENNIVAVQQTFSGPLPPPQILAGYEQVSPGAADRILKMAEAQSQHRQDMETKMVHTATRNETLGLIISSILSLILMIIGGLLIYSGKDIAGYLAVFTPIIFIGANYIYTSKTSKDKDSDNS